MSSPYQGLVFLLRERNIVASGHVILMVRAVIIPLENDEVFLIPHAQSVLTRFALKNYSKCLKNSSSLKMLFVLMLARLVITYTCKARVQL